MPACDRRSARLETHVPLELEHESLEGDRRRAAPDGLVVRRQNQWLRHHDVLNPRPEVGPRTKGVLYPVATARCWCANLVLPTAYRVEVTRSCRRKVVKPERDVHR